MQFTLKVFSLVTIENERVILFEYCDVTLFSHFSHFGAENRQLFGRVCARSIAPSVVLSMICDWVLRLLLGNKGLLFTMLLSEFVYLLRFFCKLRCELIPHILVCELLPRPTLILSSWLALFLLCNEYYCTVAYILIIFNNILLWCIIEKKHLATWRLFTCVAGLCQQTRYALDHHWGYIKMHHHHRGCMTV